MNQFYINIKKTIDQSWGKKGWKFADILNEIDVQSRGKIVEFKKKYCNFTKKYKSILKSFFLIFPNLFSDQILLYVWYSDTISLSTNRIFINFATYLLCSQSYLNTVRQFHGTSTLETLNLMSLLTIYRCSEVSLCHKNKNENLLWCTLWTGSHYPEVGVRSDLTV